MFRFYRCGTSLSTRETRSTLCAFATRINQYGGQTMDFTILRTDFFYFTRYYFRQYLLKNQQGKYDLENLPKTKSGICSSFRRRTVAQQCEGNWKI